MCSIHVGGYTLVIHSIAGVETCCYIQELDVAFDIGCCFGNVVAKGNVFITHGHIDHINAFPTHAARRNMFNLKTPRYFVPPSLQHEMKSIIESYSRMHEDVIPLEITPISTTQEYRIKGDIVVVPFQTIHRVESYGYFVYKETKRLKKQYTNASASELSRLRKNKVQITEDKRIALFAYTGDTSIKVLDQNTELFIAKTLIIELTFMDNSSKIIEKAEEGQHIHFNQILERAHLFQNDKIVFMHFSRRYSRRQILNMMDEKLPDSLKDKVVVASHDPFPIIEIVSQKSSEPLTRQRLSSRSKKY